MSRSQEILASTNSKKTPRKVTPAHKKALGKNAELAGVMRRWESEGRIIRPNKAQAAVARAVMKAKRKWIAEQAQTNATREAMLNSLDKTTQELQRKWHAAEQTIADRESEIRGFVAKLAAANANTDVLVKSIAPVAALSENEITAISRLAQMMSATIVRIAPDLADHERMGLSKDITSAFKVVNVLTKLTQTTADTK